jgi:hypothetical protein
LDGKTGRFSFNLFHPTGEYADEAFVGKAINKFEAAANQDR